MPKQAKNKAAPKAALSKKVVAIKKADKIKAPKQPAAGAKKVATLPKRNAPTKESKANSEKTLDLCLILDCTASMYSWIQRSKDTLKDIIDQVKADNPTLQVRVSFVGYRDFGDGKDQYSTMDFTDNLDAVKTFISKQAASGGNDMPEDVQGGFHKALGMSWESGSVKSVFHIADAPGHGKEMCDGHDRYPNGSPDGHKLQDQMRLFAAKGIHFTFVKVNEFCNKMIKLMQTNYDPSGLTVNVTDLATACQTQSKEEVDKQFAHAASFMLRAVVGGGAKGKKAALLKKVKRGKPLWDTKQFDDGQHFSQTAYLNVKAIEGNRVTVANSYGGEMHVSRDILENMHSADHFAKEVPMNMTALAELLQGVQDNIFAVQFRAQPKEDAARKALQAATAAAFKDKAKLSQLAKEIVGGNTVTMVCHMVEVENNLGRSLVIDLSAEGENKFKQIDHRSIDHIIYRNVKYVLKKGAKAGEEEEYKKDAPKWDSARLAAGNWFSGTRYFHAVSHSGDEVTCKSQGQQIAISRDILEYEMNNASVFQTEEKLPLTKVATKLTEANATAFTVCFTTKVDEKMVQEKLASLTPKELKDDGAAKALAKDLLLGKETTIIGRLSKAEGKMGRSLVIDLPTQGYRQVDHRTLKHLVIDNVKYSVKR